MSAPEQPAISDEMMDALLKQDGVQEIMTNVLRENGIDASLEDLSHEARAGLVSALIADGIIEVSPGRELSAAEFLEILEAEEAASEPNPSYRDED